MGTTTSYVPYDYRRICDLCGNLYNVSRLRKHGPYMYCTDHEGERINEELDRANARQRPFRVLPVPNAKPEDLIAPDVMQAEETEIFHLIEQARAASARYLQVESGDPTPLPDARDVIPVNAWACRYFDGLYTRAYARGQVDIWTALLQERIRSCADTILALQSTTGTVATNSFFGGYKASSSSYYFSEDAAIGGLAMLIAYRVLGDGKYIISARRAAGFLRNLQAIGSDGVNHTSTDVAGTSRLYTGGITNAVYNAAGFYSDHRFYPSSLLALQFWAGLLAVDGDQTIGATAAIAGDFTTPPAKLMSLAISDLRGFWATGVFDATTLNVRTGLSASTPAEFFNAYPFTKANTNIEGSGSWEFQDGTAATGTSITALNFAKAISALYAVDGLSAQVTALDDWLQTFTSNADYETPAVSSAQALAHTTTGTYAPSTCLAKYLLVRDSSNNYAATAKNADSLYDWGAFGLMAPLWATRRSLAFKNARAAICTRRRRLSDGKPSDGLWDERGFLRGRTGLTYQTDFLEILEHGSGATP